MFNDHINQLQRCFMINLLDFLMVKILIRLFHNFAYKKEKTKSPKRKKGFKTF